MSIERPRVSDVDQAERECSMFELAREEMRFLREIKCARQEMRFLSE